MAAYSIDHVLVKKTKKDSRRINEGKEGETPPI